MGTTTEALKAKASLNNKSWNSSVDSMRKKTSLFQRGMSVSFKKVSDSWHKLDATRAKVNQSIVKGLKWGAAGAAAAVTGLATTSIQAASKYEEASSKFDTVFKEKAASSREWSNQFAKDVGVSKREALEFMASTQDLFVPLGFDRGKAADMSKQVVQLAADLGSFNNKKTSDVMTDIQAAMTGSAETMKKYGVVINEAKIKEFAFANGIVKTDKTTRNYSRNIVDLEWQISNLNKVQTKSEAQWKLKKMAIKKAQYAIARYKSAMKATKPVLNDQQKAQAVLGMILKGTTDAQGDAIRTAGSFANTYKRLWARVEDLQVSIGQKLLPVVTPMVDKMADWTKENEGWIASKIGDFIKTTYGYIQGWSSDGSFSLWWERAKLVAMGFKVALDGIIHSWNSVKQSVAMAANSKVFRGLLSGVPGGMIMNKALDSVTPYAKNAERDFMASQQGLSKTTSDYMAQAQLVREMQYAVSTRQKATAQKQPSAGAAPAVNISINNQGVGNMAPADVRKLGAELSRAMSRKKLRLAQ